MIRRTVAEPIYASMRRALGLLVLLAAASAVAAGCAGHDAREAQQVLARSATAFAGVRSATFSAHLSVRGGSQELELTMSGGGYTRGKQAGDFYVVATGENLPFGELAVVRRSGRVTLVIDGHSLGRASLPETGVAESSGGGIDFSKAVGDTRVVLYVSEAKNLPMRGLVDVPMEIAGQKIDVRVDFAYTSYDAKLEFPSVR